MKPWTLLCLAIGLSLASCGGHKKTPRQQVLRLEHEHLNGSAQATSERRSDPSAPSGTSGVAKAERLLLPALYNFVEAWEGTPHRMGGMSKKGVDCSGFVILAYQKVLQSDFQYRRAEDLFRETEIIDREELRCGDLIFFKIQGRRIDHVGLYLEKGRFAHVSSSRGVMISSLQEGYFAQRFYRAGRKQD